MSCHTVSRIRETPPKSRFATARILLRYLGFSKPPRGQSTIRLLFGQWPIARCMGITALHHKPAWLRWTSPKRIMFVAWLRHDGTCHLFCGSEAKAARSRFAARPSHHSERQHHERQGRQCTGDEDLVAACARPKAWLWRRVRWRYPWRRDRRRSPCACRGPSWSDLSPHGQADGPIRGVPWRRSAQW